MLTYDDVIKIYEFKLSWMLRPSSHTPSISIRGQSGPVGKLFGVSPRTVRDIWNRQTWSFVTKELWSREPAFSVRINEKAEAESSNQVYQEVAVFSCSC